MRFLKEFYKKNIQIPPQFREEVSQNDRRFLKILFIISLVFGASMLAVFMAFKGADSSTALIVFYYSFLTVVGIIGLVVIRYKIPTSVLACLVLVCSQVVITINFARTPIGNTILVFNGFAFALILFMNMNPIMFALELLSYLLAMGICVWNGVIKINLPDSKSFTGNIFFFLIIMFFLVFWKRKNVIDTFERDIDLESQRKKAEELLRNILPDPVIEELKAKGYSSPANYENVTVLVSDFVDFTKTSSFLQPYFLINELNEIFTAFDKITEAHNCIRIKTIGDAYMAVCGLPEINEDHAEKLLLCAKEFIAYLEERNKSSQIKWKIRVGLASGSAVAGIIGKKKYLYDVLGETVESAVTMQTESSPMHIKLSSTTVDCLNKKGCLKKYLQENIETDEK